MASEEDEGDIGPVYTGAETIPRPEVTAEEHWECKSVAIFLL